MDRTRVLPAIFALGLCSILAGIARADGGFFPPPVYKKPAEIPAQRALISYRDGKETLIVESAFSTEAKDVGWIIPLPAVPDKIQPVSAGTLKTLSFCLQPDITHFMPSGLVLMEAIFVSVLPLVMLFVAKPSEARQRSVIHFGILYILLAVLAGMLLPALSSARSSGFSGKGPIGATVERQVRVGSYEVTVLRAQTAEGLDDWLHQNGFMGVPQAGKQIVTDYIRNGWCFAAAKIERAEGGLSTPHPIRFDFKVAQAVYPMRLTALAPSSPALELYLVGDGTASTRMLQREFSDAYAEVKENTFDDVVEGKPSSEEAGGTSRLFSGARYGEDIGHPDLLDVLWDKCVVTKLSGRLTSVQMKEDLSFSWTGLTPTRRHLFSYRGAAVMAVSIVTDLILLFVAVTALSLKSRITRPDGTLWYCFGVLWYYRKRFLVGIGLACVLGASFYLMVPKVEVQLGTRGRPLSRVAENIAYGLPMTANSVEGASKIVEERLLYWQRTRNEFTGEPIMREASPGNYDVREKDGRLCFVYYDRAGTEHWQRMTWSGMSK